MRPRTKLWFLFSDKFDPQALLSIFPRPKNKDIYVMNDNNQSFTHSLVEKVNQHILITWHGHIIVDCPSGSAYWDPLLTYQPSTFFVSCLPRPLLHPRLILCQVILCSPDFSWTDQWIFCPRDVKASTSQDHLSIFKLLPWGDVAQFVSQFNWDLAWKFIHGGTSLNVYFETETI